MLCSYKEVNECWMQRKPLPSKTQYSTARFITLNAYSTKHIGSSVVRIGTLVSVTFESTVSVD